MASILLGRAPARATCTAGAAHAGWTQEPPSLFQPIRRGGGGERNPRAPEAVLLPDMTPTRHWTAWLQRASTALSRGHKVRVPAWLPHPAAVGFAALEFAEDHGQERDWIAPQPDGSRLHAHEYADGTLVLHRDRYDPGAGALEALVHVATETKLGRATLLLGGIWLGAKFLSAAGA